MRNFVSKIGRDMDRLKVANKVCYVLHILWQRSMLSECIIISLSVLVIASLDVCINTYFVANTHTSPANAHIHINTHRYNESS